MSSSKTTDGASKRPRTSRSSSKSRNRESSRPDEARKFKHTAVREMINLIEHKDPWFRTTRQKVAQIANQVIDDLKPFAKPNSREDMFGDIVAHLGLVVGLIDTERFQVVSSHEALGILQNIKICLNEFDGCESSDEEEGDRPKLKRVSRPLSQYHTRLVEQGIAHHRMLYQMNAAIHSIPRMRVMSTSTVRQPEEDLQEEESDQAEGSPLPSDNLGNQSE